MHQEAGSRWPYEAAGNGSGYVMQLPVPVVALHCSGADGGAWRKLAASLGPWFEITAPNFIGCADRGPWTGERAFTLADEARPIIELIDELGGPVHLVGHSYGGGVALKVASARPAAVASLTVYEPSAFHILKQLGARGQAALTEIQEVASAIGSGLVSGAYQEAAARFIDYWNGPGAWAALRPSVRDALVRWLPKAALDFRALLDETTPIASYRRLTCPVHILRGQYALGPSRLIAEELARALPQATLDVIAGAGHMGPLTHPFEINLCIGGYIRAAVARRRTAFNSQAAAA
jgi:pimeloyl-ACP methyl ester carboxylesterase